MKLSHGQDADPEEWRFVATKTHADILDVRRRLRADISNIDRTLQRSALAGHLRDRVPGLRDRQPKES
jgi:hypothetical protein